jgi:hypothetical protein
VTIDRPSMKQDDHPDHNMPAPEHNGTVLNSMPNIDAPVSSPSYDWKKEEGRKENIIDNASARMY